MMKRTGSLMMASLLVFGSSGCDRAVEAPDNSTGQEAAASQAGVAAEPEPPVSDVEQAANLDQSFEPEGDVYSACVLAPFPTGGLVKAGDVRVGDFVATVAGSTIPTWEPNGEGAYIVRVMREDRLTGTTNAVSLSLRRTNTPPLDGGACGPGALVVDGIARDGQRAGGMILYNGVKQTAQNAQRNRENDAFPPVRVDEAAEPYPSGPYTEVVLSEQEAMNHGIAGEMGLVR